jgi:hypothetical protein
MRVIQRSDISDIRVARRVAREVRRDKLESAWRPKLGKRDHIAKHGTTIPRGSPVARPAKSTARSTPLTLRLGPG